MLQSTPPSLTGAPSVEGASGQAIVEASIAATTDAEGSPPAASSSAESTPDPTTPEAAAASASDGAPVRRPSLPDDVLSVLLAASSPLTLDEIQADVNAGPGGFTPLQFVEDELEALIKPHRVAFTFEGSTKRYVLTSHARAEIEAPGIVIERRGNVLLALARVTLGSGNLEFEHVEGTTSKPATVSAGASAEEIFEELRLLGDTTLTQALVEEDALALCRVGVLIVEEDADPAHAADLDAAEEIEDESDEEDEEIDDPAAAEDIEPRAPVSTVKVFTFALGQVDELFRVGARELSLRTMPPKEAPLSLPGAEEEAAAVLGRFEEKLRSERLRTADMETERDRYKHDLAILRGKWARAAKWLDTNGGGTDIDAIAAEPKQKTDPRIFEWSKRVRVTVEIKASIMDELNLLDTQLGEFATAEELSKASFKEKKAKIANKIAELKSASRGVEYHWVKEAYKEPDWARKVVVVRSAETHDYGTPLDEEPIPSGAQAPLFTGVQPPPPAPVPPAVDPSIAPVLGGEPVPDFTPAPPPPPAEASASEPAAPPDPDAPAFTKKVEGAPAAEEEEDAPTDKPAPLAIEMTTDNLRRLLTDLYTRNPSGIHEREEPIKFGESFAPGRPISASVATFVSRVSAMMVKDETLIEVEGNADGGRLRWLATQTDPRRLSPEALAAAQAEAGKQKPVLGMPRKAEEEASKKATVAAETAEKKRGRPKGSKNKPKDSAAAPEKPTKGKGGKGVSNK